MVKSRGMRWVDNGRIQNFGSEASRDHMVVQSSKCKWEDIKIAVL
jgi:hypothetical protein